MNSNVAIWLPRAHRNDPQLRIADDVAKLRDTSTLTVGFDVPDAASPIMVEADLNARSIRVHMRIRAPEDRKSARARTNWLLRQLAGSDPDGLHVKADYPSRRHDPQESLSAVRGNPDVLGHDNARIAPTAFEVRMVRDAGSRFAGARTFVDELEKTVYRFYAEAGQRLRNWQPVAPKMAESSNEAKEGEDAA